MFSQPVNAHFIINDYNFEGGTWSTTTIYTTGGPGSHFDPMDMSIGGSSFVYGVPAFYNFEDSEERKQCLRSSSRQKLRCVGGVALVGFATELAILAVGFATLPIGAFGSIVIATGTAANGAALTFELAVCDDEKEQRDINCPD